LLAGWPGGGGQPLSYKIFSLQTSAAALAANPGIVADLDFACGGFLDIFSFLPLTFFLFSVIVIYNSIWNIKEHYDFYTD